MTIIAAAQMNSSNSVVNNLETIEKLVVSAAKQMAKIVALPENAVLFPSNEEERLQYAEPLKNGMIQNRLAEIARENGVWLIGGTIPILTDSGKVFAACLVWDENGDLRAQYNKIHLFDIIIPENDVIYSESSYIAPGNELVVLDSPVGKLGLTICYDLRFPELFRALVQQGVEIFIVVSAFTDITGRAHWETLLRARAIENICYVIATNQCGFHPTGRATYGNSMIIDPWGKIVASKTNDTGVILHDIDLEYLYTLRSKFPVLEHIKL